MADGVESRGRDEAVRLVVRILFVLHADFEPPGAIASWVKKQRFSATTCRPFAGEELPSQDCFDWLIVMGGPQSPLQLERFPYLRSEIALIKLALSAKKTVLGFCLGAQLIGEALGALTERSPHREIGVFPIQLTQEGSEDPILGILPSHLDVIHWHNDMPGLSQDSKVLAFSEGCPRQIVRYGETAYGFQCHLEQSRQDMEALTEHCGSDLKPGQYVQSKEKLLSVDFDAINQTMHKLLDRFLLVSQ